jgi:GNAT superfamily N-acetyltransferase
MTVTYLQMLSSAELRPKYCDDPRFHVRETVTPQWRLNRFLYQLVGERWHWVDKLPWTDEEWHAYAQWVRTFVALYGGNIAGYYELLRYDEQRSVQISYFGLAPEFIGRGLGAALLTHALEQAWAWDAARVWVHTCDRDHPAALSTYEARGMKRYKTEIDEDATAEQL